MILHGNLSQVYNSVEEPQKSLEHIQKAIEISKELKAATHYEKFVYRKAKALSMIPEKMNDAMVCITQEYEGLNLENTKDANIKGLIKSLWGKLLQKEGVYDFFQLYKDQENLL